MTEQQSEYVTQSDELLAHLNHVAEELRSHGVMRCAAHVHEEIRKEERRRRSASALDDDLAKALVRRTDADESIARSQLMLAAELNELTDKAREAKAVIKAKKQLLDQRNDQLRQATESLEDAVTRKRYSPECLGQGILEGRAGGPAAKKTRLQVLDRLSKVGPGLSTEQRNDWVWFKTQWDVAMANEHKENWGGKFATMMQAVVDEF